MYLNDAGGVIDTLHAKTLALWCGSIVMHPGTAVIVGNSAADPGTLAVGGAGYGWPTPTTLAAHGPFTAYATSVNVAG